MSEISKLEQKLIIKKIDKETVNIQIFDNNILSSIVGEFNANLIQLEKLTEITLFFRGNSITAKGNSDNLFRGDPTSESFILTSSGSLTGRSLSLTAISPHSSQ